MKAEIIDWKEDVPAEPNEEYQSLVRALKWEEGFGLFFVECSTAGGQQIMAKLREDIPGKKFDVLPLDENVYNFYELVEGLPNREDIDVLFVTGLEYSLFLYEKEKREEGWDSKEIYSYSWRGVPPVLVNLNQQRERFRDNFDICFVFLIPRFAVNYFIERAPDFFDWRSGLFRLSIEKISNSYVFGANYKATVRDVEKISNSYVFDANYKATVRDNATNNIYTGSGRRVFPSRGFNLSPTKAGTGKLLLRDSKGKRLDNYFDSYKKGNEFNSLGKYENAIAAYDSALQKQPEDSYAWSGKGDALKNLGRYEEAISAYTQALKIKIKNNNDKKYELCYKKASCYALQGHEDMALTNLQLVINFGGIEHLELAKTDADFDSLRESDRFQKLINQQTD